MKYVQAILSLGLFGYLGYAVLSGTGDGGGAGSSKGMALRAAIKATTDEFGTTNTGLGLIAIGILLATFFATRRAQEDT